MPINDYLVAPCPVCGKLIRMPVDWFPDKADNRKFKRGQRLNGQPTLNGFQIEVEYLGHHFECCNAYDPVFGIIINQRFQGFVRKNLKNDTPGRMCKRIRDLIIKELC